MALHGRGRHPCVAGKEQSSFNPLLGSDFDYVGNRVVFGINETDLLPGDEELM
jgi:hypothetical protein